MTLMVSASGSETYLVIIIIHKLIALFDIFTYWNKSHMA